MDIKITESRFRNSYKLEEWMEISVIIFMPLNSIMFSSRDKPVVDFA